MFVLFCSSLATPPPPKKKTQQQQQQPGNVKRPNGYEIYFPGFSRREGYTILGVLPAYSYNLSITSPPLRPSRARRPPPSSKLCSTSGSHDGAVIRARKANPEKPRKSCEFREVEWDVAISW